MLDAMYAGYRSDATLVTMGNTTISASNSSDELVGRLMNLPIRLVRENLKLAPMVPARALLYAHRIHLH
jgi:hypothetical protein